MTTDDVLRALDERGAALVIRDGSLRYVGPTAPSPDDPIRAAIQEHRSALVALLSQPQWDGATDHPTNERSHRMPDSSDQASETTEPSQADKPSAPPVNPGMLMTVGYYHGYPRLPLKRGVSIAAGATAWRTFTRTANADMLALAAQAAREMWSDDPMTNDLYYVPPIDRDDVEPCRNENGVCQESMHEHFDFDDFFDDHRAEQEDRHLEHGATRGQA